jgi:DNA replication licensing factor MCM5
MQIDGQGGETDESIDPSTSTRTTPPTMQVMIRTGVNMLTLRDLTSDHITKIVRTPGIIIQTSTLSARATKLHLQCRACRSTKIFYPATGLSGLSGGGGEKGLPRICDACAALLLLREECASILTSSSYG